MARRTSAREREVLALLSAGLGNKEIGAKLGISRFTVTRHIENLMDALEVEPRTRIALAMKARSQNSRAPMLAYRCEPCDKVIAVDRDELESDRMSIRTRGEEVLAFRYVCPECRKAICEGVAKIVAQLGGKAA